MADVLGMIFGSVGLPIIVFIAIMGVGIFLILAIRQKRSLSRFIPFGFPINVEILERRGDAIIRVFDKARFVETKDGDRFYELKKRGDKLPAVQFKHILSNNWLLLFSPNRLEYYPMAFTGETEVTMPQEVIKKDKKGNEVIATEDKKVKVADLKPVIDEGLAIAYTNRIRRNHEELKRESALDKWLPVISVIFVAVAAAILMSVQSQDLVNATKELVPATNALKDAVLALKSTCPMSPPPA